MTLHNAYRREIDACRPGSNDLALPELADLARAVASDPRVAKELEASHSSDIVLCDGLQEVAIPSGLADRLLASVDAASRSADKISAVAIVGDASEPESSLTSTLATPHARTWSRRAWFIVVPALAASLAVAATLVFWQRSVPRRVNEAELASMVEGWYEQVQHREGWTSPIAAATSEQFPVDSSVVLAKPVAERSIPVAANDAGVAYQLKRGDRKALLFVIRTPDHFAVSPVPSTKAPLGMLTGRKTATAWQSGAVLYVLVVDGGNGTLRDFLRPLDLT